MSRRDGPGILATLELTTGGLTKAYRAKRKYVAEYRKEKDEAEYKDQQSLDKDDLYNPDAKKRIVDIQHGITEIMAGCTRGTYAADAAKTRVDELLAVWKSTSASGAPDNSSLSHFAATTRPCRLRRAVRTRQRRAIELCRVDGVEVDATIQHERAVKF